MMTQRNGSETGGKKALLLAGSCVGDGLGGGVTCLVSLFLWVRVGECGRGCFWAVEFVASLGGGFGSSEGPGGGGGGG